MNSTKMKAVVCTKYGPPEVLQIKEVAKPEPNDNEVLIKIFATAVTASDIFIRSCQVAPHLWFPMRLMIGLTKPRNPIIGLVLAGEIESAGKNIKRFKPGDRVYGITGFALGAYAEYKCMRETDSTHGCLELKPENLTYEEATVAIYGGVLAFQYLGKGNILPGQNVLIYGASGTSGTIAVQLAKFLGADVTAVCSTANLELLKSLGADRVIDYTRVDSLNPGDKFDFILDAVGKRKTSKLKKNCKKALVPGGKYVSIDDGALKLDSSRLALIKKLVEAGHIKPVIDRIYPLEKIVEAHSYVGKGHKKGGIAITVAHDVTLNNPGKN
jgi:NADPH:quinone reductase-like Zn-dependent oxidoreductase